MNNDITINVFNQTPEDYTIVVFQQDPEINGMFTRIFPTAWQVIPLGGLKNGVPSQGSYSSNTFIYPLQMQVSVTEHNTPYSPNTRYISYDCALNSKWDFDIENNYQRLTLREDKNVDGTISCNNNAKKKVDICICKNNKPLLVYRGQDGEGVQEGDCANLQLTPKIYLMYASEMQEGVLFNSYVNARSVQEIDLTNICEVDISLVVKDPVTGLKGWDVIRKE